MLKSSKTSLRDYGKYGTRKNREDPNRLLKPYNFCCDINNRDDETHYDMRKPPFYSSLMMMAPMRESPTLKLRVQSIEPIHSVKRRGSKGKLDDRDLDGNPCVKTRGSILWYQEDEVEKAKAQFWSAKQAIYNEEADRNALLGEKKAKKKMNVVTNSAGPRWYQDLSISQMKQVLSLEDTMTADYEEAIHVRTQNALAVIGVTSTFCKIAPQVIKKLQGSSKLQPIQFLREIYRRVTGQYFEEEEYKNTYDCNERIILSAIAFLGLPDVILELNNRLPPISKPVFPPKPKPPRTPTICHSLYKSPYNEPLFQPPDWATYRSNLDKWYENCKLVPRPKVILPLLKRGNLNEGRYFERNDTETINQALTSQIETDIEDLNNQGRQLQFHEDQNNVTNLKTTFDFSIPKLPGGDKQTFDFTISGLGENTGPVNYKICGTMKPPFPKRKSWLGEKEAHYIISGISEHEDPPQCPVTYVMTGISCVTPDRSDDKFFTELKLGDGPKRVYPAGRKNLSKNWQEWLQDVDEEFLGVEREANKLIKSVEATMRLVIPGNRCDGCCSCRQTRKTNLKTHATKTPYMVIDSIAEGDNQNKYIVGSLAMHSPAPSPVESTVNLLEVVASKDYVHKKLVINGITNDSGETTFYISGVTKDTQHTPKMTVFNEHPPKPLRNVPPCACTIEQIFNEGKSVTSGSGDDIPHTKTKGLCFGRKYRPRNESPPFTCKEYPNDKCCRRNPFDSKRKMKRGMLFDGVTPDPDESDGQPLQKRMFTLPKFSPCGDEEGMAVCGGKWGAKIIADPKIVAAREAEAKQILKGPPCGDTPGRAVCGGPWGARNPTPKRRRESDEEEEEEDDEEGEEEGDGIKKLSPREIEKMEKEAEAEARKLRKKQLKRDHLCSEKFEDGIADADQHPPLAEAKPVYCDFDNPWDRMRTAPTVNPWNNEYEKSLGLTHVSLPSHDHKVNKQIHQDTRGKGDTKKNHFSVNVDANKIGANDEKDTKKGNKNLDVIYDGKQITKQTDVKVEKLAEIHPRKISPTPERRIDNFSQETAKLQTTKAPPRLKIPKKGGGLKPKSNLDSERGNGTRKKPFVQNNCPNNRANDQRPRRTAKPNKIATPKPLTFEVNVKSKMVKTKTKPRPTVTPRLSQDQPQQNKKLNERKVLPAVIPEQPRLPCQRETMLSDGQSDNCGCSDDEEAGRLEANDRKEGPFGWRTESQQKLPREKTLVYLAEPTYPVQMVKVREGGKPCTCRENRNNKKILLYNIGGAVNVAKGGRGSEGPQLIKGVTYLTPDQSPRNSSEYIPEYDLLESPYENCTRRSDHDLKRITNAESCSCRHEPSASEGVEQFIGTEGGHPGNGRWSSALKDEALVDHFTKCRDAVPCWLKCAKYSKAGCCMKPKLLQVKKPVCECRYERRVVRREEEKQRWVGRQQRLKSAKKQPIMQVAGTLRPMGTDTKLMISSVKKVLKDGEFSPEIQYCVTGVAENYAMGPPELMVPGITMQSPLVTPEPSKPDILCMCDHKHWSLTDVKEGLDPGSPAVKATTDYPCRGRMQKKELSKNTTDENVPGTIKLDSSKPYVARRICADAGGACSPGIDMTESSMRLTKRRLVKGNENAVSISNRNFINFKSNVKEISQGNGKARNEITEAGDSKKAMVSRVEDPKRLQERQQRDTTKTSISLNGSARTSENSSAPEIKSDLFGLMKIELEKMASEDFILAKLPECWLMPQLKSWIEYREGKVHTDSMKKELYDISKKQWAMMQKTRKPSVPLPTLNLTPTEAAQMNFDRAVEMKRKIPVLQAKYLSDVRKKRVSKARAYWPTMEFGKFPSLGFKEAYFTYMAGKEADGHVFRPWKIGDSKDR